MGYSVIETAENKIGPFFLEEKIWADLNSNGICFKTISSRIEGKFGNEPIPLGLFKGSNSILTEEAKKIPDFMYLGVIPILSEIAKNLAESMGCINEEFKECYFETNRNLRFYMHLPENAYDVVDYGNSKFRHEIPVIPPIPYYCESLTLKGMKVKFPPLFRVSVFGHSQVSGELFVTRKFESEWGNLNLSGALFRHV